MSGSNGKASGASRNGAPDGKVRVAIVGVGNCASSFVQGVEYYKDADPSEQVPGLMHVDLGGYHVSDIEFTAAFDIELLAPAIYAMAALTTITVFQRVWHVRQALREGEAR